MKHPFDEATKRAAQTFTRRGALRSVFRLAGVALACFGLTNKAHADKANTVPGWCKVSVNPCCCRRCKSYLPTSHPNYPTCVGICSLPCAAP